MATCKDVVKRLRNLYNFYFSHNSFRKVGGSDNIIKYGKNCRFRDCHVYIRGNHNSVIFSENCNMMGLNILIEVRRNRQIGFQIDIDDILELLLSEFAEDIGLSHLAGAVDNQRLAVGSLLFPGNQLFLDLALHIPHLTSTAYL